MQRFVDIYIVYQLVKRLITPFDKTPAFKRGIIDAKGNVLRPIKTLTDPADKNAWTWLDVLINNLKRLMAKLPGGTSMWFTLAMGYWLSREPVLKLQQASKFSEARLVEAVLGAESDKYLMEADTLVTSLSAMLAEIGIRHTDERRLHEDVTPPETFAGFKVFVVNSDTFTKCRLGKRKYARYEEYVGNDSTGEAIRAYGRSREGKRGIILMNNITGAMLYLRHPGNYHLPE